MSPIDFSTLQIDSVRIPRADQNSAVDYGFPMTPKGFFYVPGMQRRNIAPQVSDNGWTLMDLNAEAEAIEAETGHWPRSFVFAIIGAGGAGGSGTASIFSRRNGQGGGAAQWRLFAIDREEDDPVYPWVLIQIGRQRNNAAGDDSWVHLSDEAGFDLGEVQGRGVATSPGGSFGGDSSSATTPGGSVTASRLRADGGAWGWTLAGGGGGSASNSAGTNGGNATAPGAGGGGGAGHGIGSPGSGGQGANGQVWLMPSIMPVNL